MVPFLPASRFHEWPASLGYLRSFSWMAEATMRDSAGQKTLLLYLVLYLCDAIEKVNQSKT
jgi:hypothetical protein